MRTDFKQSLLRNCALAAIIGVAIAKPDFAHAATGSNLAVTAAYDQPGNLCFIGISGSVTGTTSDQNSGFDLFRAYILDANENAIPLLGSNTGPIQTVPVGQTSTYTNAPMLFPQAITPISTQAYVYIYDVPSSTVLLRQAIPTSILQAAGGACLNLISNQPPTVNAGPDTTVNGGDTVTLSGSATDPEMDPLTFGWTQVSGPAVTLGGATTLTPSFTAPAKTNAVQALEFSLVANDGTSSSTQDTVVISVAANVGPTADAGPDQSVNGNSTVTLDGSASVDGDGDTLTYSWVQTAGPAVTLSSTSAASPTFTAPAANGTAQSLLFDLVVSDGLTSSAVDSVDITVLANSPPVADAGADQGPINTGSTVTLDGSGSSDPDNDTLTYSWTQVSGPAVVLSGATTASPSFTAPNVQGTQNLVFQLVVNDGTADSAPDTVTIAVRAVGSVTIIQRVIGDDRSFSYTSDISALNGSLTTSAGTGQLSASLVPAGTHTLSAADLSAAGYALTDISCNDSDSTVSLTNRSVAIALSPNEDLVCTFTSADTRSAAASAIADFLTARNAALLAQQPDLQRRLDRLNGTPGGNSGVVAYGVPVPKSSLLPVSLTVGNTGMQASTSLSRTARAIEGPDAADRAFDIWAEAYLSRLSYGPHRGTLSVIYAGMDYRFGKDVLAGVMVGIDDFSRSGTLTAGAAEGNGWMAGPYVMARVAPDFYVDARAAWGKSDNTVSPLGTFTDGFNTSRAYYSGAMVGEIELGSAAVFRPEVTVRYLRENQKAYVDSLGVTVPSQVVDQGDVSFRPRFYYTAAIGDGWSLRPYGEAEGILTFGLPEASVLGDSFRMRVEGGLELMSEKGIRIGVGAFYDGIGGGSYDAKGAHVSLSFGF